MNETSPSAGRRCRRRIIFAGRVQGVGFRYTAAATARTHCINGYVRNCPDGSVELVAEGPTADVERMLQALAHSFAGNIERQTVEEHPPADSLDGFEIRR
jgi:acylphosphatase